MGDLRGAEDAVLVDFGGGPLPLNSDWSSERDVCSNSKFCVSPTGDSFSTARLTIVIMSTCIPDDVNGVVQLPFGAIANEVDLLRRAHQGGARAAAWLVVLDTLRKLAED